MKVLEELNTLQLNSLDEEWINAIYYSEFLEFGELPNEYENILESIDISTVFLNIMNSFDDWLNSNSILNEDKSWTVLSAHVQHQKLLGLLAYFIDNGNKNFQTKEYRNNALLASRLYYKLLAVPGYKAYHIYHSQLFAHSLTCLGFPKLMCEHEENYFNSKEFTREVNSLIKELRKFVLDLRTVTDTLQLSYNDMNFEDILSNLVDVTGGAIVYKLNIDKIELTNITRVIYEIIDVLVCNINGDPCVDAIQMLFKCLLPKLVAASVDCRNMNNLVRASYVTYSGLLLTKYGKAALSGFSALLQHLCYTLEGLERVEVRTARVSLVIGLMSLLPQKSYRSTVKWLLKLSTTSKMSHRHIALEMLAKLLNNDPEAENENITDKQPLESSDDSETENEDKKNEEKDTSSPVNLKKEEGSNEEDISGALQERAHTVPHAEILRAVYERVHDVSSTLRTRALAILADCLQSDRMALREALEELNGTGAVGRLMAVAARCVCDERAAVRRAAVSLIHRHLVEPTQPAPSSTDLAILVGVCRDASILVRSAAITALGDLVLKRTSDEVLDAFLSGPMHQLSDPESKVQEQVVLLVQQLLIDRIQNKMHDGQIDVLPWKFLAGITRCNMRRHLQKACSLLAKSSNCINHRLIDMLSTHLGSGNVDHDLYCLVLLTSVARHVDYSDVAFVFEYYYKLADELQNYDVRLMSLTLELCEVWARWADAGARLALRDQLVRRLAAACDDGCRTACAALAAHLDPDNLQWATELMQISERRALAGGSVEEWLRAADLSLVAPVPPSAALMQLYLTALSDPDPDWTEEQVGAVVAGVGRLCVRSREAAAAAARSLAELLQTPVAPLPARVNALLALTDICTRYTCIVEPLLGSVCDCLSPQCAPPLRRATARALTRLLLAGYLRLRTPLYYRYCALLSDEDHDVREPAEYYVTCCLTADVIYHHFVECVLHYNKEESGVESFDARQLIYDVMLQRLSLVQKLNVQCRLAREILQHAADVSDEGDELPPSLNAALLDTITLLCGPRMKLPKKPQNNGDVADIEDLQERVTTNIVSHKMKRTVAEVLVPAVLRLYGRLRAGGGQVAAYLVRIATDLLNDYRHEIEELIDNDEELVERVRHFQETIGLEPSFGNARNLVTSSAPPEPETPRSARRRPAPRTPRAPREPARKRALRM